MIGSPASMHLSVCSPIIEKSFLFFFFHILVKQDLEVYLFSSFSSPTSCSTRAEAYSHNIPSAGRLLHLLFAYCVTILHFFAYFAFFACSHNIPPAGRLLHLLLAYFVTILHFFLHILHFLRVLMIFQRLVASCICSHWQLPNEMISCAVRSGGKAYDQTL